MASGVNEVIVVTGANGDAVAAAIEHLAVRVVRNPSIDGDMAGSVRIGLTAVSSESSGVMICLADQPLIERRTYQQLLRLHDECPGEILIPVFEGKKGHPTIFPRLLLQPFSQDMTLRDVVQGNPQNVRLTEVADPGVVLDMDTPSDYQALRELFSDLGT